MLKVFNVVGVIVLLLLLRKLIWCLRWLWCWKHDWRPRRPSAGCPAGTVAGLTPMCKSVTGRADNGFLEKERGPLGH